MAVIPFTQYLRPDGRAVQTGIIVKREIYNKAKDIINLGYVFECEHLTNGQVSFTITDPEVGDLAIKVTRNGPEVRRIVYELVEEFYDSLSSTQVLVPDL